MNKEPESMQRTAYRLEEAAGLLKCSVAALLDWGSQGEITLCTKITGDTSFRRIKEGISTEAYPCSVTAASGQYFAAGQARIAVELQNHIPKPLFKASDAVSRPCRITGFFSLMPPDISALTESEARSPKDVYLRPYGMTQDEKDNFGLSVCRANISLGTKDIFLNWKPIRSRYFATRRTYRNT